ncbi:hypothetical protein [Microbacterium sp. Leaf159]|uniref:hypothetical protein n=1 Tax=Microbacterium sp. Leaf159 TaxID=1736279 RepID=UPI0007008EF1|nr:hypothetical protein [Microbacterium sp. Leaf159]KQR39222.1 hypothetical protein ASF80_07295 [Microbacterium sp. Leaf159]
MRLDHPSLSDDDEARVADLHDWLFSNRHIQALLDDYMYRGSVPPWYSELLSNLTLLSGGDTVEAVFVDVDMETYLVSVGLVTSHRVIAARVTGRRESRDLSSRAVSRRGVRDVRTEEPFGIVDREPRRAWPGPFALTVTIDGFDQPLRFVPSAQTTFEARQPDMGALTRSFLTNLDE